MKARLVIPLCLLALSPGAWAAPIQNPMRDFLRHFDTIDPKDVVRTEPDLNNDGIPEVFLTYNNMVNGREGNIWVVYRSLPGGGYERIDEASGGMPISFHQKAAAIRKTGSGAEIVRYAPGGSGRGVLSSYRLDAGGMAETVIREISPQGGDAGTYQALFQNPSTRLVFVAEDAKKLRWKHAPVREWLRSMTLLKWCLYIIGLLFAMVLLLLTLRAGIGMIRAVKS